jgi:hypothetical protein
LRWRAALVTLVRREGSAQVAVAGGFAMSEAEDALSPLELGPAPSVSAFFGEAVSEAVQAQGYDATFDSKAYVTALLTDYAAPRVAEGFLRQPMGVSLLMALQSHSADRFNKLRAVGDEALLVSGFFSDHLRQRGLEVSYASGLGAVAYDNASQVLRRFSAKGAGDVFSELAHKFEMFVELLQVVADSLHAQAARGPVSLLELYERWRRSGSAKIGEALLQRGITPLPGDGTLH